MRIAVIGSRGAHHSYGGIERVLAEICPRIAKLGHEIHVFSEAKTNEHPLLPSGVKAVYVPALQGKFTETITRSLFATAYALASRYDVINYVAIGPGSLSMLARICRTPVVVSIHGLDWHRNKWPAPAKFALQSAERALVAGADEITVVSQELVGYFKQKYDVNAIFTPNGVDIRTGQPNNHLLAEMGLTPNEYVLFASRLVPEKAAHELIEAFQHIPTSKKLVIAGGSRYDNDYVARLHLADKLGRCVFPGHLTGEKLDSIFKGAYLYVLPSHIEGLSLSLLEALGYGKATLVSDIPENIEVVGNAGFSFPVGNISALTSSLTRLLLDPDNVLAAGCRSEERAKKLYSWDIVAKRYADLYERLGTKQKKTN